MTKQKCCDKLAERVATLEAAIAELTAKIKFLTSRNQKPVSIIPIDQTESDLCVHCGEPVEIFCDDDLWCFKDAVFCNGHLYHNNCY